MGVIIPPPPPYVPPASNPQGRPEVLVVAAQRPIAPQTTRAVAGASRGKDGNKAADPDHRGVEGEGNPVEGEPASPPEQPHADAKQRGGKLSIDI
jgi:hypothetical protein